MIKAFILVLLTSGVLSKNIQNLNPFSSEFIDYINSQQSSWKAGKNFDENTPISEIMKLVGSVKSKSEAPVKHHSSNLKVPDTFDSATQWPECEDVINTIVDQSSCGSCWAVAAASAMSDRRCIQSKGALKVAVSAEDLLSCCDTCGFGCEGGFPEMAWAYWHSSGLVTGGLYNSSQGCKTYSMLPCEHHSDERNRPQCTDLDYYDTPSCKRQCDDSSLDYNSDLTFGEENYSLNNAEDIQKEILQNGPVEATFNVYQDFLSYKSGVYQYTTGDLIGGHAVRIVGWGVDNGTPYWRVANSWNTDWGEQGYFRIIRGINNCDFESQIDAALAKI